MFVKEEWWFLWVQRVLTRKKFVRQFLDLFAAFINVEDEIRHLSAIYIKLSKTLRDSLTGMQVYLECVLENAICNSSLAGHQLLWHRSVSCDPWSEFDA
jgi:hypothetical protein